MKLFVMSDIHSHYDAMMNVLIEKGFDINNKDHRLVVCGDLFDRGPDTVKVFEFVKGLADEGRLVYIMGNHEELLFDCVHEVQMMRGISSHHASNGTLGTVAQFTGVSKVDLYFGTFDRREFANKIEPLLSFIENETMDLAEAGDYVFVHGWIPCDPQSGEIPNDWDTADADWESARWINGMLAWNNGARLEGRTIVCGHWHTSWGHAFLRDCEEFEEFPVKGSEVFDKCFQPFVDEGIIAIDACTAYSGFCNCIVIEV